MSNWVIETSRESITQFLNYQIIQSPTGTTNAQWPDHTMAKRGLSGGHLPSRPSLRSPHAAQSAWIHNCRSADSGAGYRRKQRNLYGHRFGFAASSAIQKFRPPRVPERREQAAQGHVSRLPQFSGLAEPESCL